MNCARYVLSLDIDNEVVLVTVNVYIVVKLKKKKQRYGNKKSDCERRIPDSVYLLPEAVNTESFGTAVNDKDILVKTCYEIIPIAAQTVTRSLKADKCQHFRKHTKMQFPCFQCDDFFQRYSSKKSHLMINEMLLEQKKANCNSKCQRHRHCYTLRYAKDRDGGGTQVAREKQNAETGCFSVDHRIYRIYTNDNCVIHHQQKLIALYKFMPENIVHIC
ncbi:unnamed protein product [Mytilus edulis]|uniref:Uncharacterized protein n=1 Tax=Mytilus edulis TaxID=6550 RepID=A0A8S3TBP8_MYTED|nr:unnamed protein product [Mytilus edulis]